MIQAKELRGRTVVDVDSAAKLGQVDDLALDPVARRVAGIVVSRGAALLGGRDSLTIPAPAINAFGDDAVTVYGANTVGGADFTSLPRLSKLLGRTVISEAGRKLGAVGDVLFEPEDGRIVGYVLDTPHQAGGFVESLFGARGGNQASYVRADANVHVGEDVVVVRDDATPQREHPDRNSPAPSQAGAPRAPEAHAGERSLPQSSGGQAPRAPSTRTAEAVDVDEASAAKTAAERDYQAAQRLLRG
jgi:uncharacterized protein YrrD